MKKPSLLLLLVVVLTFFAPAAHAKPAQKNSSVDTDVYSLIAQVNALRAANGLAPYAINATLMGIAQSHAGFMAANGVSHYGVGGSRPFERALAAGYPLAGDLTQGGFFSENITAGINKSAADAVLEWQGDAPHLNTMLSASLTEIGAGVVLIEDYVYFVIDCGKPTSSGSPQVIPTGMAEVISNVPVNPVVVKTIIPNTPDATGLTNHIVKAGETLWLIAISYGIKIDDIKDANYFVADGEIYPGQKLAIPVTPRPTETPFFPTQTVPPSTTPDVQATVIAGIFSSLTPSPTPPGIMPDLEGLISWNEPQAMLLLVFASAIMLFAIVFMVALSRMQRKNKPEEQNEDSSHKRSHIR